MNPVPIPAASLDINWKGSDKDGTAVICNVRRAEKMLQTTPIRREGKNLELPDVLALNMILPVPKLRHAPSQSPCACLVPQNSRPSASLLCKTHCARLSWCSFSFDSMQLTSQHGVDGYRSQVSLCGLHLQNWELTSCQVLAAPLTAALAPSRRAKPMRISPVCTALASRQRSRCPRAATCRSSD